MPQKIVNFMESTNFCNYFQISTDGRLNTMSLPDLQQVKLTTHGTTK